MTACCTLNVCAALLRAQDPRNTADLSLIMSGPTAPVAPGTVVPLTALVNLNSPTTPVTVQDVQVVQDMPPGECSLAHL